MTDTPRTNEAEHEGLLRGCATPTKVVRADFARQLERENAELLEALDGMVKANGGVAVMPTSEAKAQNAALAFARAVIAKAKEFSHE